ncbi:hypothetical protein H6G97_35645 [Nostoc flagelliforme FACHB-838]|uniref:Uncharacterized protein n=1 Tax=Nostoc flagelliforme FACHB-838 TaxID=2692904 RepID=A0ABR8DYL9_9NOSO|nr:hypothetical protein [Nostoc flagelliforme FACHB-838]
MREATQFKAAGDEPLTAKLDLKVTQSVKDQLKAIPGWQNKVRSALLELIKNYSQDEPSN